LIPFYKLNWTVGGTIVDLTKYCLEWDSKQAIKTKSNAANFRIGVHPLWVTSELVDSSGNLRFENGQNIAVYLGTSPVGTADIISNFSITGIEPAVQEDGAYVKLICGDKSVTLLSMSGAKNYNTTAPEIIKYLIGNWSRGSVLDGGYIQSTTSTGGAFPTVQYSFFYKPIADAIEEVSQPAYTNDDKPYIYWVDENNYLHWQYPYDAVGGTITEGMDNTYKFSFNKKESSEVNMIIYNSGKDKNDNSILWYQFNWNTRSGQLKFKYYDWSEIATQMRGYSWEDPSSGSVLTWDVATNSQVREYAKTRGSAECTTVFSKAGMYWKGNVTLKGTKGYTRGQLINIVSDKFGNFGESSGLKLRISEIVHSVNSNGWTTEITLDEDPDVVGAI
jgi:hypothetical protein